MVGRPSSVTGIEKTKHLAYEEHNVVKKTSSIEAGRSSSVA